MLPREFVRRQRAFVEERRFRLTGTLLVANHIRAALGMEPLEVDDLFEDSEDEAMSREDWEQMARELDERRRRRSES